MPVVLISVDTLRADHLPAYGYRGVATPALDALARDSILFENAYSHVPLTLASHATLFTGLLPPQTGVRDNYGFSLKPGLETLASFLKSSGRETGGAVSAAVLTRKTGIGRGFDFYEDNVGDRDPPEREGSLTELALEGWLEARRSRPFFAFLHLFEPHAPYEPPEPYRSRYPLAYDGEIARADEIVGVFLARLKSWGVYDRCLIIFLSDHGEGLGQHGEREHGIFLYREAIHVPLLIKLPGGRRAGEKVSAPVALTDVFPTIARAIGRTPPPGLPGRDLLHTAGQSKPRRIYGETFYPRLRLGWSDLASLIDDRNHYIEAPRPELYDIRADPGEKRDLSATLPPAFRSLRLELSTMSRSLQMPESGDAEQAKKLASLGYLTATSPESRSSGLPDPKDRITLLDARENFQAILANKDDVLLIEACRRFLARVPAALDVWRMFADALERQGRREEAIQALEKGLRESSSTATPALRQFGLDRLIVLLARAGRTGEVLKVAAAAPTLSDPDAWNALGVAQGASGRPEEARQSFERALALDPNDPPANLNLGLALLRAGDAIAARPKLENAVKLEAQSAEAWNGLGQARSMLSDEVGAIQAWKQALSLDPHRYDALFNLAIATGRRGDPEAARRELERFVVSAPPALYGRELTEARRLLRALPAGSGLRRPS
jgi:choline-sulfatase